MENSKKVLIVTYYWPPAGGPGVQRWLKFAKYLPEFSLEPVIFTPENPSYPLIDETLKSEVPKNTKIIRTNIWEPYQLAEKFSKSNKKFKGGQFDVGKNQSFLSKLSIFIRGNFFIPDARKFWVKPSIAFLKKYLKENDIDLLVTTGPPHSLHLIGLGLKKELPDLKWIADFRDPWTEISYYKHLKLTKSSDRKHKELEKAVFQTADVTLATSYTDAENFRKKGANSSCITNGFDISEQGKIGEFQSSSVGEFEVLKSTEKNDSTPKRKFTISYVGVLEQLRNPENLWKALDELCKASSDFAEDFELKFVGRVDDKILNALENSVLKDRIKNLGYLAHQDSVTEMRTSDLLIITNFPNKSSKGIIPGKLFEYLATGKKIISFGPKDADVETILNRTNAGQHFDYSETDKIKDYIFALYLDRKNGKSIINSADINEFSRKELTKKLSEIIKKI
ncbi:glycosyl transferase family 1 [Epilithonimonas sp.]|uniref:glycosyl transferase family 1 n=1 Tax=Epilithonimonas sp. TaxID=2894511 RepID=UPI0035B0481C